MSDEKRCDCCKRYWYCDDLVSGLCPNCLDFLATKNQISIEQDQKIKSLEHRLKNTRIKYFIGFDSKLNEVVKELDLNVILPLWMHDKNFKFYDTKEEAKAKLEEMQDGN